MRMRKTRAAKTEYNTYMDTALTQRKNEIMRITGTILLWVGIVLSFCLVWLWRDAVLVVTDVIFARKAYSAETTADHPALLLASLEYKTNAPSERQVALFGLILNNLHASCVSESREDIADALLKARRESQLHGKTLSLKTASGIIQGLLPKIPPGSGSCIQAIQALETYVSF